MKMKQQHYIILSLLLLSILGGTLYYNYIMVDTQAYVPAVYYMQGIELNEVDHHATVYSYAFKRPIEIGLATLLEPFVGVRHAYSLINVAIYMITTLLTYYYFTKLFREKSKETKQLLAYIGAVLYAISLPLLVYASRVLVDIAGYLTILLGLILIEWVLEKKHIKWFHHLAVGLLLGTSLLVRDAIVILYPYYVLRYMLRDGLQVLDITKIKNIKKILVDAIKLWPLIFTVVPELIFMALFNVSFLLAGKGSAITPGKYSLLGWIKFIIIQGAAFHVAYLFAAVGIKSDKDKKRLLTYGIYTLCAMIYLVAIQLIALSSPRFSMVLFPAILGAAAYGILELAQKSKKHSTKIIIVCLGLYAVASLIGALFYPEHTKIAEDAGADVIVKAMIQEVQIMFGWH